MSRTTSSPTSSSQTSSSRHPSASEPRPSEGALKRLVAPYAKADNSKALFQLLSTALLFVAGWVTMYQCLEISYALTLLFALPTSGFLIRLFIFQHDCGHGSFFSSRKANNLLGALISVPLLTPYSYWRRTHAIHHASSGDLDRRSFGDIGTLTVEEYRAKDWKGRLGYRLYRNPLLLLTVGPIYQFFIKHRLPLDIPRSWKKEWLSIAWTNSALLLCMLAAWQTIGLQKFLLVQIPVNIVTASIGMWLFYIQHQFEDTYWRRNPEWEFHRAGLEGSSFYDLPAFLHWFTGNIGFHHIHHVASRIPNYHLKACFQEVPEMQHVTRLSILGSLRCASLALWDEKQRQLVSFRQARRQ